MAGPSDEPRDAETGRLAELAERRARRAAEVGLGDRAERAERTVGALERRLEEAEGRLEIAQRERTTLAASLERAQRDLTAALQREFAEQRLRAEQEGEAEAALAELEGEIIRIEAEHDAAAGRAAALARALEAARHQVSTAQAQADAEARAVVDDEGRAGRQQRLDELEALAEELRGTVRAERATREDAERVLATERERAEAEVTLLQHELDRRGRLPEAGRAQVDELRVALDEQLAAERAARLVVERELERERQASGAARVALTGLREELEQARSEHRERAERDAAVESLVGELVETAHDLRVGFERELEGLAAERDAEAARQREAYAALTAELRELQATGSATNPIYDTPTAGPRVPTADHPALTRPAAPAEAPAVVGDLARALDRLRSGPGAPPAPGPSSEPGEGSPAPWSSRDESAPPPARASESDWFARRLAGFARTDEAAAERLLLSSLAVQASAVGEDVAYQLELPVSGRFRVTVVRGRGASVEPAEADRPQGVEFRLKGGVAVLAPLVGGEAPRRLAGASVRGRRRRLRRLLRALDAPVGLARLRDAGADLPTADLLAMLCDGVPEPVVRGADFAVAYDVAGRGEGDARRVVVRARPDGRLGLDHDPVAVVDAVVALDASGLLSVLDGSAAAGVSGDPRAADALHRWLRDVQRR